MSSGEYESVFDMIAIPGGGSGTLQDGGTGGEKIWWVRGGGKREISGTMMGSFQNCGNCGLKSQRDPAAEKIGESVVQGLSTILWFLFVCFFLS